MNILNFKIGGFANLDSIEINLNKFNALVALNNYGKSNVISAIQFGFDFIVGQQSQKNNMMAYKPVIPINKYIDDKSFQFEIVYETEFQSEVHVVSYGFSFEWIKNDKSKGQRIVEEFLKAKPSKSDSKFKSYLMRDNEGATYLPSVSGRCDKKLIIQKNELAINKLKNYDELFYLDIINGINNLKLEHVDTLQDPDMLFRTINPKVLKRDYSLEMPDSANVGFFIFSLKKQNPGLYEMFKESVKSLLPSIDDFTPIEIDFKKEANLKGIKGKIPMDFPEKLYDIQVKEVNNNQQTNIDNLSSGSQKMFYVLALTIAAEINKIPLIMYEELENSIHPGLLQKLLLILDSLAENTKIILTSHSPYLIQYLDIEKIKIGIPNSKGLAVFKEVKKSKFNKAIKIAEEEGVSVGDLIFDNMIECANGESELLNDLCM